MAKQRVLSGIQPTGRAHIGNYLGAFVNWVRDQSLNDSIFLVVDLHGLTVENDRDSMGAATLDMAATLFAVGIDPGQATVVIQSHVPGHVQLGWVMECTATYGELSRMTQFKDKSKGLSKVRVGLFTYPALMAADILLYHADLVPVGDDQTQHLELARDLAIRFNNAYGETFTVPKAQRVAHGSRVMDLANPLQKMSKSSSSPQGIIFLSDSDDEIARKIARAKTDTFNELAYLPEDPERAGVTNLLEMLGALTGKAPEECAGEFSGYGQLKKALTEALVELLTPIKIRFELFQTDPAELARLLAQGADRANEIASDTVRVVYDRLGLVRSGG